MSLEHLTVAVAGLGPMGRGIARVLDRAGAVVMVVDLTPEATTQGLDTIRAEAEKDDETVSIQAASLEEAVSRADLLIEAIVEEMGAKEDLLAVAREHGRPDLIVASNTSSLSIGAMGKAFGDPSRVVGLHFFNPPTKMRLVEVIRGVSTSDDVHALAVQVVEGLGKTPVTCSDSPNFVVNRICRPLYYESQLLAAEGVEPAVVDAAARGALGHRMGPLQLLDFTGLHTHLASSETAYREFGDPRYRPIPRVRQLVRNGLTGRAVGRGFYDHEAEPVRAALLRVTRPAGDPSDTPDLRISVIGPDADRVLSADSVSRRLVADGPDIADADVTIFACHRAPGDDELRELTDRVGRGTRVVVDSADGAWLTEVPAGVGWFRLHTWRDEPFAEVVHDVEAALPAPDWIDDVLDALGAASVRVPALPGLVGERLASCLANEAFTVVEEGTATREDVDVALRLAMNHPAGPFEYADRVGVATVHAALRSMLDAFGDPRYRPAQLMRRQAAAAARSDR
jgi:3-hydroxybutyryl-CoA dehydrogenase